MPTLDLPNGYYDLPPGKLANIATFLAMQSPPDRNLVSLPGDVILRRADPRDLSRYRAMFRDVGQDLMWFSRMIMPDAELEAILSNPEIESFILDGGDNGIGLLELNFAEPGKCELAFFGLIPKAVGSGLGRALMDEAIRRAFARKINQLWVHTCTFDSPQALPFYIRSGFIPFSRKVEIHDDPRLGGYLSPSASPQVPFIR